jgi:hypothetical protein
MGARPLSARIGRHVKLTDCTLRSRAGAVLSVWIDVNVIQGPTDANEADHAEAALLTVPPTRLCPRASSG